MRTYLHDSVPYTGPTYPAANPLGFAVPTQTCPQGQVQDFDPATNSYLPSCVDDTAAYHGVADSMPKVGDSSSIVLLALLGVIVIAVMFGSH